MISCCFRCSSARAIVEEELSLVHLAQFLTEQFPNFKQQEELINNGSDKKANLHRADRWLLSHRFSVSFFFKMINLIRFLILRLFFAMKKFCSCKIGLPILKLIFFVLKMSTFLIRTLSKRIRESFLVSVIFTQIFYSQQVSNHRKKVLGNFRKLISQEQHIRISNALIFSSSYLKFSKQDKNTYFSTNWSVRRSKNFFRTLPNLDLQ